VESIGLLVDAGPLYAYVDADDRRHDECLELLSQFRGELIIPLLVVSEVTYLIATRIGTHAVLEFLNDLASGVFITEPVAASDWSRIIELVRQYQDLPLGTVDASLVAAAERTNTSRVATLDHRHFSVVKPRHVPAFEILP
jgi:predicted nucleic acid-binding protein